MIIDYGSSYLVFIPLSGFTASAICKHSTIVLTEYCLPSIILADYGSQFVSKNLKKMCKESETKLIFSSTYHHQANSLAEKKMTHASSY